jgi:hypothetical protein
VNKLFHRLANAQFNSRVARGLLSLVFREGNDYPVLLGPIRGARLHYERAINYHSILGLWETESYRFLHRLVGHRGLCEGSVVADVGANVGYFALWASRVVGAKGRGRISKIPQDELYAS